MTSTMAAIFAYDDRKFRYLASFLYFEDMSYRLLALESSTENKQWETKIKDPCK